MALYDYKCPRCEFVKTWNLKMALLDTYKVFCPECAHIDMTQMVRVLSAPSVHIRHAE